MNVGHMKCGWPHSCEDCLWYYPWAVTKEYKQRYPQYANTGECKRYPPVHDGEDSDVHVIVSAEETCGEWQLDPAHGACVPVVESEPE